MDSMRFLQRRGLQARLRPLLATLAALGLLSTAAPAQGGYRDQEVPAIGLTLPVALHYDAIPQEPTERWIVQRWVLTEDQLEKVAGEDGIPKSVQAPVLDVILIERRPDPEEEGKTSAKKRDQDIVDDPRYPTNSVSRYLLRNKVDRWKIEKTEALDANRNAESYDPIRYRLKPGNPTDKYRGWAQGYENDERIILFLGEAHEGLFDDHVKIWEKMVGDAELKADVDPDALLTEIKEKYYRGRKAEDYLDVDYRAKVRAALVKGWDADDTENYIYVYSTKDEPLLRAIKKELEAIRQWYVKLFPPAHPVTAVSTVRICKDRDEYMAYGGPPNSGGYWNSAAEELVFYDYEDVKGEGRGSGKADTRIVLYHEAFHQYIYYSTGELPPHSWYNEGTGDYFSGAKISGSKVTKIGVNPWRIETIQDAIERDKYTPWAEIVKYEQAQYYNPSKIGVNYAQGWSMIYFLRESKVVEKHDVWSQILDKYFNKLKSAYAQELEAGNGRGAAGLAAREQAIEHAFQGVDFNEIEAEWKAFILDLKVPR
jgi:hypothetical protein